MDAIKKLDSEMNLQGKLSLKAKAVMPAVHDALCEFCRQHEEFAQAVKQTDKTLPQCCEHCVKDTGNAISDLEVFRKAAKFYFLGAEVSFVMQITLPGDPIPEENADAPEQASPTGMLISLDELLGM